jgi:hypothetical protein
MSAESVVYGAEVNMGKGALMSKVSVSGEQREQGIHDYDKFCVEWEERIKLLVNRSRLFSQSDVDDVVQELLENFYVKDYLEKHDAEKSNFSTSVYTFVSTRIKGLRDRQMRQEWREGLSLNDELPDLANGHYAEFIDLLEGKPETVSYEFIDMVKSVYKELQEIPVKSNGNDFSKLFACLVQQVVYGPSPECVEALGEKNVAREGRYGVNRQALAYEMGVCEATISNMLKHLAKIPVVVKLLGD